jgi:hypothetical protein
MSPCDFGLSGISARNSFEGEKISNKQQGDRNEIHSANNIQCGNTVEAWARPVLKGCMSYTPILPDFIYIYILISYVFHRWNFAFVTHCALCE